MEIGKIKAFDPNLKAIVNQTFTAFSRIIELLTKENTLLDQACIDEIGLLQDNKSNLIDEITKYKMQISKIKDMNITIEERHIAKLQDLNKSFVQVIEENQQKLTTAILVNKKIMEIISSELVKRQNVNSTYNKSGNYQNNPAKQNKFFNIGTESVI